MFVRLNSHRSREKLLLLYPDAKSYYYAPKLFKDKSKGYYWIDAESLPQIIGTSKPKDQDPNNYGRCW